MFNSFRLCFIFTSCENTTAQNGSKQSKKAYDKNKSEIKNKGSNLTLAPDFELADLEGNKFKLSSLRGKVVLLNFGVHGVDHAKEKFLILSI